MLFRRRSRSGRRLIAHSRQAFTAIRIVLICEPPHFTACLAALTRVYIDVLAVNGHADIGALELQLTKVARQIGNSYNAAGRHDRTVNRDSIRLERMVVCVERSVGFMPVPIVLADVPAKSGLAPSLAKALAVIKAD